MIIHGDLIQWCFVLLYGSVSVWEGGYGTWLVSEGSCTVCGLGANDSLCVLHGLFIVWCVVFG